MQTERVTIPVYNLGCAGGGALTIEQALRRVPGVAHAYVNPATEMAYVDYDSALIDPGRLRATITRAGYGPPPPTTRPRVGSTGTERTALDVRRLALAAGLALSAIYVVCLTLDLLFPQWLQMYRLWEQVLVGVAWERPETLLLGLVETFLYGALGVWLLAGIYRVLPPLEHA
jgi:cation transport ATPase